MIFGQQKTARSAIPNSFCSNLFTLCTLQVFTTLDGAKRFYQVLRHFSSFDSAACLIADELRGGLGMVKRHDGDAAPTFLYVMCEHGNAIPVICINPV